MRIEASVTSVSWIPSEAISGMLRVPFDVHVGHYDQPLPDAIEDLESLREADAFRFANELRAWVDVDDGEIVDFGYLGHGHIGSTTLRFGVSNITFAAVAFPDLQLPPEVEGDTVRFVQTAGGRTGVPAPRVVSRAPYVQMVAPTAWTTLSLEINADGSSSWELVGASPFPRHWVYDDHGQLAAKSGLIDFKTWSNEMFGDHTPWEGFDTEPIVADAETALERMLSAELMGGANPKIRKLAEGEALTVQGEEADELYLLLDGMLSVDVDGELYAEVGPGAILGERALIEEGKRTSTLRATTPSKVAAFPAPEIDEAVLAELAKGHAREDEG